MVSRLVMMGIVYVLCLGLFLTFFQIFLRVAAKKIITTFVMLCCFFYLLISTQETEFVSQVRIGGQTVAKNPEIRIDHEISFTYAMMLNNHLTTQLINDS